LPRARNRNFAIIINKYIKRRISIKERLTVKLKELCSAKHITLSLAESCTGGRIGDYITNVSGSSVYFLGGIIAYSNEAKINILQVPSEIIAQFGAVSPQTALAMAKGAKTFFNSKLAASVTGIAGPAGGSAQKPVGLVYIALVSAKNEQVKAYNFSGTREQIKEQACITVLQNIVDSIEISKGQG
jgi:PncC family amidohydrolase